MTALHRNFLDNLSTKQPVLSFFPFVLSTHVCVIVNIKVTFIYHLLRPTQILPYYNTYFKFTLDITATNTDKRV